MWENCPDGPVGALFLARDGRVTVGAAGATNCQGKGGPWDLSTGQIPKDQGNAYGIAIEAANAGTGEPWPAAQTDAYVIACRALCDAYGLAYGDVLSHWEWCEPSCPGRKIDPAGPSPWATGKRALGHGRVPYRRVRRRTIAEPAEPARTRRGRHARRNDQGRG